VRETEISGGRWGDVASPSDIGDVLQAEYSQLQSLPEGHPLSVASRAISGKKSGDGGMLSDIRSGTSS